MHVHAHKILNISPPHRLQDSLSKELGISGLLAQVLLNRGICDINEAEEFLNAGIGHLLDPYSFADMRKAVKLIEEITKKKEKVMVFGDYDVDGVTSLVLLKDTLAKRGVDVTHYLPHRVKEGYGLNKNILHLAKQKKIKLLITVDCGINNAEEIKELKANNIETIITDHHEPLDENASSYASAVINPKLKGANYKYKDLAGVGVAYKLCQALTRKLLAEDLDLVSLGTIADVVPLTGENRVIAKEGLLRLSQTKRMGLRALIQNSGLKNKKFTSTFVSFILAPRLNASGRLDSAETALNLLMSKQEDEAERLAKSVEAYNRQRQKIESKILDEARWLIEREVNFKEHKVIVLAKDDWHPGVLGIVASKLADRFYRPTIIISLDGNLCRGSGRSIKNFHLFQALLDCREFLAGFGGHAHAVGLTIDKGNIDDFKNKINRLAKEKLRLEDLLPSLDIDMELSFSELNSEAIRELERLEPFGTGNPEPLFYTRNLKLKSAPEVLGNNTLKFWASDGNITYQVIGFGMAGFRQSVINADYLDLVYTPVMDNWHGEEAVLLEAKDIFLNKG